MNNTLPKKRFYFDLSLTGNDLKHISHIIHLAQNKTQKNPQKIKKNNSTYHIDFVSVCSVKIIKCFFKLKIIQV